MRQPEKLEERGHDHHPLRVAAEEKLTQSSSTTPARKEKTPEALIHELQAHQVDLVMQNEKLRRARPRSASCGSCVPTPIRSGLESRLP